MPNITQVKFRQKRFLASLAWLNTGEHLFLLHFIHHAKVSPACETCKNTSLTGNKKHVFMSKVTASTGVKPASASCKHLTAPQLYSMMKNNLQTNSPSVLVLLTHWEFIINIYYVIIKVGMFLWGLSPIPIYVYRLKLKKINKEIKIIPVPTSINFCFLLAVILWAICTAWLLIWLLSYLLGSWRTHKV